MRKRIKKPYIAATLVVFLLCFAVKNAHATTNIDNCTVLNETGETYLLTADIDSFNPDGICIDIVTSDTIFDCQGHTISNGAENDIAIQFDGNASFTNSTVKNCIIVNTTGTLGLGIYVSLADNVVIENNTLINSYDLIGIDDSNNVSIINNTMKNATETCIYWSSTDLNVTISGNIFQDCYSSLYDYSYGNNNLFLIYNNKFNDSIYMSWGDESHTPNIWNTTRQSGTRIYSAGTEIGGNYWTNSTANGYSDTCTDLLQDGFCDDAYDVEAGVACAAVADGLPACGNNTDWLPLSAFYEEPQCVQSWNCTAWGECVRGYQTRVCTDDNSCQNETGKPTELQVCLSGLPNASFNVSTAGCCPISTIYCTNNETLLQVWNTSEGLSWASQNCPYGCDNATSMCVPVPYQQNLYLLVIFAAIVVIGLAFIRWVR